MAYQQDPPNWQQLSSYQTSGGGSDGGSGSGGGGINQNSLNLLQPPIISNIGGSILRPPAGLTSDHRARVTKLLPQQADQQLLALNCPRCDSTNTKFCYYNNYSLTQPRHFCKTCRRYWTRGGALRNVPVGGGCRRNKRSKGSTSNTTTSSRSKSPVSNAIGSASNTSTTSISTSNMLGHFVHPSQQVQSSFYPSLRNLGSFGTTSRDNIRLNYGSGGGGGGGSDAIGDPIFPIGLGHEMQQFQFSSPQMQQFNFASGGFDHHQQQSGLYQQYDQIIQGEGVDQLSGFIEGTSQMIRSNSKQPLLDFGVASSSTHLNSLKSEENQELISSRNFMGAQGNNEQYWGNVGGNNANAINTSTSAWSDLSSFTSSFSKP